MSAIRPGVTTLRPIWPTHASPPPWATGVPGFSPSSSAAASLRPSTCSPSATTSGGSFPNTSSSPISS